jgi:hypothetical protein
MLEDLNEVWEMMSEPDSQIPIAAKHFRASFHARFKEEKWKRFESHENGFTVNQTLQRHPHFPQSSTP